MKCAGVILAGGLSRRMDGREKAMIPLGDQPLIAHVIERLRPQVSDMAINANGDAARFDAFGLPVAGDVVGGHAGPLAGVLTGLRWAAGLSGVTHIATVATDTPFFPTDLVAALAGAGDDPCEIRLAGSGGHRHPVFGLWPLGIADSLETFLQEQETRKVMAFVQQHPWQTVDFGSAVPQGLDPFFNINTPEDLAVAEAHRRQYGG